MGEVLFIEVSPHPDSTSSWKDITINAGASQSTLQDIKLPETAGGYSYQDSLSLMSPTSNRFIYWRTNNDILELVEVSTDACLMGSHIRLRFQNTPLLEGISIHETQDQVVILVATVSTVHRLMFPHPRRLKGVEFLSLNPSDVMLPSIFYDASIASLRDSTTYFVLNHASAGVPLPHTSCSWLTCDRDAVFVLANSVGSLLMVHMEAGDGGKVASYELRRTSVMSRLWSGLVPSVIRGAQGSEEVVLGLICHFIDGDYLIFALCKDLRIRLWSYNKQECLMAASVLEYCGETGNNLCWNLTAQQCILRKAAGSVGSKLYLGVFMSLPEQNQFCIFQPLLLSGQYHLSHISTLYGPEYDLVDFRLTFSHLWTLWLNFSSEPVIKITAVESDGQSSTPPGWISVAVQSPVSRDVFMPQGKLDMQEAYLKEIFYHGRFSTSTISKAISIYRRTVDVSFSNDIAVPLESLKKDVSDAVEREIRSKATDTELPNEEYLQLQVECWDRFFSYCLQYHEVGLKPLALFLDPSTGLVIVIKKNSISFLRPCDEMEHLVLSEASRCSSTTFSENLLVSEDPALCTSLLVILDCVEFLHRHLTEDMVISFEHELMYLVSPETVAEDLVRQLSVLPVSSDGALLQQLQLRLQMVPCLVPAFQLILKGLDLSHRQGIWDGEDPTYLHDPLYNRVFSSTVGIGIVCEGTRQLSKTRFVFCRDLLILEIIMLKLGENCGLSFEKAEKVQSSIVPLTSMFTMAYCIMVWATECDSTPIHPTFLESGLRQLSLLDIPVTKVRSDASSTIVHLFVSELGGTYAHQLLGQYVSKDGCSTWGTLLPALISSVAHLIWPISTNFIFPEFLLTQHQHLPLKCYIRLLQNWCEWNICSRQFLLASCHLSLGSYDKAIDLFHQASEGVSREQFLKNKILQNVEQSSTSSMVAHYYLKVIQLFECFSLSDCIISVASTAINSLEKDDPNIPIFWSLIFKYHLELGNSEEAYSSMTRNPDLSRRKDCLRQLIVVLCERKQLRALVEFPYIDMQQDVISILESRARSCDLLKQKYYDLLYSYHVHCNNFRRAATVMYEFGMRLGREVCGLASIQKQACCYLATINALHLVNPQYQWIVKPLPGKPDIDEDHSTGLSPKRNSDGEEITRKNSVEKVEVLELADIRKEYQLVHARLLLLQKDPSPNNIAVTPLSPADTVTLLVSNGLFELAIQICIAFSLSLTPVFEGLTSRAISLIQHGKENDENLELLDWFGQNNTSSLPSCESLSGTQQVWYLLKNYLQKYEPSAQTVYHRCVAVRLLVSGVQLPAWLKRSYQIRNCAELLWLYLSHGLLENATDLAVEYIDAVLGQGKEDFGIKQALHSSSPPVWLPYTYLDTLLESLEECQVDSQCRKYYEKLNDKLGNYSEVLESVSKTMVTVPAKTRK